MDDFTLSIVASILIMSVGLYFGIIMALFGLFVLAGSVGRWSLARSWLPTISQQMGIVVAILAITFRRNEMAMLGLAFVAMGHYMAQEDAPNLNRTVEAGLLSSALVSVAVVAAFYVFG
jgi:hypothetical protein